jgi:hypothetical protein
MTKGLCALVGVSAILVTAQYTAAGDTRTIVGRLTDVHPESRLVQTDDDEEVLVVRTKLGGEVAVSV